MLHIWREYWNWTGGNIGALPLEALVTFIVGLIFRKRLAAWWGRHSANGWRDEMDALRAHVTRQAAESHAAMLKSVDRRHQEVLDRVDTQHEAVKAHITAQAAAPPPPPPPPARQATTRKGSTHG